MTSNNWITLFIASVVGVAVWIALTVPDIGAEHLTDEDWYDL